MSSLTDLYISDSYTGLLHAGGIPLPVSGQITMFDGSGQVSALSLGVAGQGIGVTGRLTTDNLTVGTEIYPSTPGSIGQVLWQVSETSLGFTSELPSSILPNLITAGTYDRIKSVKVTAQGLVDTVNQWDDDMSITFTTYFNSAQKQGDIVFQDIVGQSESDWNVCNLTNKFDDGLAGVFFLEALNLVDLPSGTKYVVYASPDGTDGNRFPIQSTHGGGEGGMMIGSQFQCPIQNGQIFFKIVVSDGDIDAITYRIWGIAKQG